MEPAPLVRVYPPCFTFWRASGARLLGAGPRPCRPPGASVSVGPNALTFRIGQDDIGDFAAVVVGNHRSVDGPNIPVS